MKVRKITEVPRALFDQKEVPVKPTYFPTYKRGYLHTFCKKERKTC